MQAGEVATKGVLGDACAAGYRERRGMADGGARVPEILSAAEPKNKFLREQKNKDRTANSSPREEFQPFVVAKN